MTHAQIAALTRWSAAEVVETARGTRAVRTSTSLGAGFWSAWRSSKADLQAAGVVVRPTNGSWGATWYSDPATVDVTPESAAPARGLPEAPAGRSWSDEQTAIFGWFHGARPERALVVRARAGTGKTTTIKAAFTAAPEESMLYAVFNKRNEREAAAAITDPRVEVRTLHALGYRLIRRVWEDVRPDDAVETERVLTVCGTESPAELRSEVRKLVGLAKNLHASPSVDDLIAVAVDFDVCDAEPESGAGWTVDTVATAAARVLELSRTRDRLNRISFNDMVWLPVALGWVVPMFDLVVIDEAQDMNALQLTIARGVCRSGGRFCAIGDDRQAIYGFRGADEGGLSRMVRELDALELGLTLTYRCPKAVVALAAETVSDYWAAPGNPEGAVLDVPGIESAEAGDVILSRTNAPLVPACFEFLRRGIPARIEGRDIGATLKTLVGKLNARSIPQLLERLEAHRARGLRRAESARNSEALAALVNDTCDTIRAIAEGAAGVSEMVSRIEALFVDNAESGGRTQITLSTVHKAKGLEWDRVFVLLPTFRKIGPGHGVESNIWYVAITRARQVVFLAGERR